MELHTVGRKYASPDITKHLVSKLRKAVLTGEFIADACAANAENFDEISCVILRVVDAIDLPRLCEKSRAIVKLDIFSKTLRTFVVLSGIALTGPKCGTLCARTIARIASNLTR